MPYKQFQPNILSSSEVQTYLMNQSVMVFANSVARSAALTLPTEGMMTYLQDVDELEMYNGSAWLRVAVTSDDETITVAGTAPALKVADTRSSPTLLSEMGRLEFSTNAGGGNTNNDASASIAAVSYFSSASLTGLNFNTGTRFGNSTAMTISPDQVVTTPKQPYVQARGGGATGQWVQPNGILYNGNPAGFTWTETRDQNSNFNPATGLFQAPYTGVYLCVFKCYQQNSSGTGYIHWLWQVGGVFAWNSGSTPYNIYGYNSSNYAEGVDTAAMIYVTGGTSIGIFGSVGNGEQIFNDHTYLGIWLLG